MFAFEHYGIVPDMVVLGKGLGGAVFPMAALIARRDLDVAADRALGHYTHEKSPVGCAAALATIDVIEREALCARAQSLGAAALERMRALKAKHPIVAASAASGSCSASSSPATASPRGDEAEQSHVRMPRARPDLQGGSGQRADALAAAGDRAGRPRPRVRHPRRGARRRGATRRMQTLLNLLAGVSLLIWGTHIVRTGVLRLYGGDLRRVLRRSVEQPRRRVLRRRRRHRPDPEQHGDRAHRRRLRRTGHHRHGARAGGDAGRRRRHVARHRRPLARPFVARAAPDLRRRRALPVAAGVAASGASAAS